VAQAFTPYLITTLLCVPPSSCPFPLHGLSTLGLGTKSISLIPISYCVKKNENTDIIYYTPENTVEFFQPKWYGFSLCMVSSQKLLESKTPKESITRIKRQHAEWEKIFCYLSIKGLISRLHKELKN
jgi:hypothetical protein